MTKAGITSYKKELRKIVAFIQNNTIRRKHSCEKNQRKNKITIFFRRGRSTWRPNNLTKSKKRINTTIKLCVSLIEKSHLIIYKSTKSKKHRKPAIRKKSEKNYKVETVTLKIRHWQKNKAFINKINVCRWYEIYY